jgi:2-iminobutanoate/2-iminopropanoate deaminase
MKHFLFYSILFCFVFSCTNDPQRRTIIQTENAPTAIGPYSQAVVVGNTLYAAGQIGLVPETGELAGDDLESQTRQTLDNLKAVLEAGGFSLSDSDVVSVDVYLDDLDNYTAFNEIYSEYFYDSKPARGVVEVSRIPRDAKVEVKLMAVKSTQ